MPEYHSPEEERALRRVNTRLLCMSLRLRMHFETMAQSISAVGAAAQKFKDTCDKHEIRRLDQEPPKS